MLEHVITEQRNPASAGIHRLSTEEVLVVMNDLDCDVPRAVRAVIPRIAQAVEQIAGAIRRGDRVFFLGAGTSGRLCVLEAAECPPTFGIAPEVVQAVIAGGEPAVFHAMDMVEDDSEAGVRNLSERGFGVSDVLVGISASGESLYVVGAVEHACRLGAPTIGICCNPASALARSVRVPIIPLSGPEFIAGSTRLKAATAAKLVLNMLTTASMVRLGHVYDNLMVNVQPTNRKLRERARRIVAQLTGASPAEATALLESAGGSIKAAVLMHQLGVDRAKAESLLAEGSGQIGSVLDACHRRP